MNASISREANQTYLKDTGRTKVPLKSLIYLQDFELLVWMRGPRPSYEIRITRFRTMSTVVGQEISIPPQRIEEYEFMQEIHTLLVQVFHMDPLPKKEPLSLRSGGEEQGQEDEIEEEQEVPPEPPNHGYRPSTPPDPSSSVQQVTKTYSQDFAIQSKPRQIPKANTKNHEDPFRAQLRKNDGVNQNLKIQQPTRVLLDDWTNVPRIKRSITKVPEHQAGLLAKPEAWLPPPPGRQFPTPSLPLSVLKDLEEIRRCKAEEQDKESPLMEHIVLTPRTKPEKSLFVSENTDSDSELGAQGEEDEESDEELLPGTWESTPHAKRIVKDALPADTPPGAHKNNSTLQLYVAASASSPPAELEPEPEAESGSNFEPELESSLEEHTESMELDPESPLEPQVIFEDDKSSTKRTGAGQLPSTLPVHADVEEFSTDVIITKVKKKTRRSFPWDREKDQQGSTPQEKKLGYSTPQDNIPTKSIASLAEDAVNAVRVARIGTPRRTIGPTLKDITEYLHSSPPRTTSPISKQRTSVNPKRSSLGSPMQIDGTDHGPSSSIEIDARRPQGSPKVSTSIPKAISRGSSPRLSHNVQDVDEQEAGLPSSAPQSAKTALVPSTHPPINHVQQSLTLNLTSNRPHNLGTLSGIKRKEIATDREGFPKRPKVVDMPFNMTQDTPVQNDPQNEVRDHKSRFFQLLSRQPISSSPNTGTPQSTRGPVAAEQRRSTLNNHPSRLSFGESSFRRSTPMPSPQSSFMPPPSLPVSRRTSFEVIPQFNVNEEFDAFVERYNYPGNQEQFLNVCKRLADPKSTWFEFLYDDVIMKQATEYPEYAQRCLDLDEDILKYPEWAKKEIKRHDYTEGIMTAEKLSSIMEGCRARSNVNLKDE